jgi:hypothetical protein
MRSIRRSFKGPSVPPKTQPNHAVLLRTRLTTLWRSEIHINVKIDADALNRRRRRFCVRVQYVIYIKDTECSILVSAHASTVYAVSRIKPKTKQILPTLLPT